MTAFASARAAASATCRLALMAMARPRVRTHMRQYRPGRPAIQAGRYRGTRGLPHQAIQSCLASPKWIPRWCTVSSDNLPTITSTGQPLARVVSMARVGESVRTTQSADGPSSGVALAVAMTNAWAIFRVYVEERNRQLLRPGDGGTPGQVACRMNVPQDPDPAPPYRTSAEETDKNSSPPPGAGVESLVCVSAYHAPPRA
jgi:hypothetical protein